MKSFSFSFSFSFSSSITLGCVFLFILHTSASNRSCKNQLHLNFFHLVAIAMYNENTWLLASLLVALRNTPPMCVSRLLPSKMI